MFRRAILAGLGVILGGCASVEEPRLIAPDAVAGASLAAQGLPDLAGDVVPLDLGKKVLVVYFSQGTATKRVAQDLALLLGADSEQIVELRDRQGFWGFLGAGSDSAQKLSTPIVPSKYSASDYGLVVVCTPVWAWSLAPPVRTWLQQQATRLPDCVFVEVSAATQPEAIIAMMVEAAGGKMPVASAGFVESDFAVANKGVYADKLRTILGHLRP